MDGPEHRRHRRLQVPSREGEAPHRCHRLRQGGQDRRRHTGDRPLRQAGGPGDHVPAEAQRAHSPGRRGAAVRPLGQDGVHEEGQREVREEPGEELLRHRHEGGRCRGVRIPRRDADIRDREGVLRGHHGDRQKPQVRSDQMEHHGRGRHNRQGPAEDHQIPGAHRRFQDLPVGAAGQQMDSHAHALHLEVRAHRGVVPQHVVEPLREGDRGHIRLRVLRRQDGVRPHRRMLLRIPHGGERASAQGGPHRRRSDHEGGPPRIRDARGGVERQGERPPGSEDPTVPLREPGRRAGARGQGHGHKARRMDSELRRDEGLAGPEEDRGLLPTRGTPASSISPRAAGNGMGSTRWSNAARPCPRRACRGSTTR